MVEYPMKDKSLEELNSEVKSIYHNLINMNKMVSDLYLSVRNLENFMHFAENKFNDLADKDNK